MNEYQQTSQEQSTPERNLHTRLLELESMRRGIVQDDPEAIESLLNYAAEFDVDQKTPEGLPRLPHDILDDITAAIQQRIDQQV